MTSYRRLFAPGASWFFTINLAHRGTSLLTDRIDDLRDVVRTVRLRHPFIIDAAVVLPEHLHAIWTLPPGDSDFPLRWRLIKTGFSRRIPKKETRTGSRAARGERGIWQRRYWEHRIRDDDDLGRCVDYIHFNPVKHGLVAQVRDWPYSSFHRYVRGGLLPPDWAGNGDDGGEFGEPDGRG